MREKKTENKTLSTRSCPICRVAMVRDQDGWHCPQCGSVIVDAKAVSARSESAGESAAVPVRKSA